MNDKVKKALGLDKYVKILPTDYTVERLTKELEAERDTVVTPKAASSLLARAVERGTAVKFHSIQNGRVVAVYRFKT